MIVKEPLLASAVLLCRSFCCEPDWGEIFSNRKLLEGIDETAAVLARWVIIRMRRFFASRCMALFSNRLVGELLTERAVDLDDVRCELLTAKWTLLLFSSLSTSVEGLVAGSVSSAADFNVVGVVAVGVTDKTAAVAASGMIVELALSKRSDWNFMLVSVKLLPSLSP